MPADTLISTSVLSDITKVSPGRALVPSHRTGTFTADDTDYHAFVIPSSGKGKILYAVHNPSNKDVVVTLYGAFSEDSDVGGGSTDNFIVSASGTTVTAGSSGYKTCTDPFPYYIVRLKFADTPNGESVTIYTAIMN
jgi:hypothetical protein